MTVQLELKPEVEATLANQARARGISLSEYLQSVVDDLARAEEFRVQDPAAFRRAMARLAEMGQDLTPQPSAGLTREDIYQDHD